MKIYTKTGDAGQSALYDGSRHAKDSYIFEVLGEIDELSCRIGVVITQMPKTRNTCIPFLRFIQVCLQDLNSLLATPKESRNQPKPFCPTRVDILETHIDNLSSKLPRLSRFILPGVSTIDSSIQLCRTQTRKVERFLWHYMNCETSKTSSNIEPEVPQFINRLSDFFFMLARLFQGQVDVCA
jgi:cob(I)alamin adenosyltransferase